MQPCDLVKAAKSKQPPRLDLDDIIVASLEAFAAKRNQTTQKGSLEPS